MSDVTTVAGFGAYGDYGSAYGANPAAKCAKYQEKYQRLYQKGAAPWRVRRAKKLMDKHCASATATQTAFTSAYESTEGEAQAAQAALIQTSQAALQPASKTPLIVLVGGAVVIAALLLATSGKKGEEPQASVSRAKMPARLA